MRKCLICSNKIIKKPKETWIQFKKRRFCCQKCYWLKMPEWRKGKKPKNFEIAQKLAWKANKGRVPWNKGLDTRPLCKICNEKHSFKSRLCWKCFRGKNHPNWKNGITPLYWKIRNSNKNKLWRKAVFERDNFTCVWCGDNQGGNLNADHVISFSSILHNNKIDTFNKALKCKKLWNVKNGQTLCHKCHQKTKNYGHLGGKKKIHFFKNTYDSKNNR